MDALDAVPLGKVRAYEPLWYGATAGQRRLTRKPSSTQQSATAQQQGCSCVQQCYNEWRANLATCNGGYWCQVGYNLLFELCLADCLIPG